MIYKAVIFDMGGVMTEDNSVMIDDLKKELDLTDADIENMWSNEIPLLGAGRIDEAEFWQRLQKRLGVREVNLRENLLGRAFEKTLKRHEQMYELVANLKRQGYVVAMLSDTIEPHARAHRSKGHYDPFDEVVLSYEVGYRKSDKAIYELILKRLNCRAEDAVFIDDRPKNVAVAESIGIRGIVFTSEEVAVGAVAAYCLPGGSGNADVLLLRKDGAIIFQKRDTKPGISNPGIATGFGGGIEEGETPLETIIREVGEETNLKLHAKDFEWFNFYRKTKAVHGEDWDVWFFVARDIDDTALEVYEGEGFVVAEDRQAATKIKTSILVQEVLDDLYAS